MKYQKDAEPVDYDHVSALALSKMLKMSDRQVRRWATDYEPACPKNSDGTFSLKAVFDWYAEKERSMSTKSEGVQDLETEKLAQQIESLKRDIAIKDQRLEKLKETMVERSYHEQVCISRAGALRWFLTENLPTNAHFLAQKSTEELRPLLLDLAREMMGEWINGSKNIDRYSESSLPEKPYRLKG